VVTAACSVIVKITELAAIAAAHRVHAVRCQSEFSTVLDRIAPLRHAGELMAGMVSDLDRKNCWTIAEHRGALTPDGQQHLLPRARCDADDERDYVIDALRGSRRDLGGRRNPGRQERPRLRRIHNTRSAVTGV
jgi:hypothetical protein